MWYTYIILSDNNKLYTGITTDIARRWQEHTSGVRGARFFRTCKPVKLCRLESFNNRADASAREAAIKKLARAAKEALIASGSPEPLPTLPRS
ncbi:GIY-YIG nuclease family protein [Gilvimarinus japonicus]|jgi:putative endonuclease|uniref:GIY-YIG nuclease family protein n=1 Tax=Gilvimarinus japonicus TaxID=1796469 RepID=A0ABV7HQS8_9GAMM